MKTFSVVIPIFNGAKYIGECLDSLYSQNFNDFEIIVINDGSTDESEKIVKEYSNNHRNLKLVTIENSGPYLARKKGIELCNGKYICFVDCDDIVTNDYFSVLSNAAISNADIISFNILIEDKTSKQVKISYPHFEHITDYRKYILDSKSNNLVSKIFKRSICKIDQLINVSCITEEDLLMQCSFANYCSSIFCVDNYLYLYKYRLTSTTKSDIDFKFIEKKFNPYALNTLLQFDTIWGTNFRENIIANKLNFIYDFFIPIIKRYKWGEYSSTFLNFAFIDLTLLKDFDFKVLNKRKRFILKPLIFKNKLKLWARTRIYILIIKLLGKN